MILARLEEVGDQGLRGSYQMEFEARSKDFVTSREAASALETLVRAIQSRRLTLDPPQGNSMRGGKG